MAGEGVLGFILLALSAQAAPTPSPAPSTVPVDEIDRRTSLPRRVEWKEETVIGIRVPVAGPGRELMTTVSFPEERIETAITGWPDGSITARASGGRLFLRLPKAGVGHVGVVGGSGTHFLLYVEGVDPEGPGPYDTVVRIVRRDAPPPRSASTSASRRPIGSLDLIRAMRRGLKPAGARVLRAAGEEAYRSDRIALRLLFVYEHAPYVGRIYEIENLTPHRQPLDASRFRGRGEVLILSALRENVLPPRGSTRLYTVFWEERGEHVR